MNNFQLNDLPLFKDLSLDETTRFIDKTRSRLKKYPIGTRILNAYDENRNIGIIVNGEAQIVSEDRMGNEVIGHRLERGAIIGSISAILEMENNPASVESLTEVEVLWIPYRTLISVGIKLGRIHGIVMKNLLESFCKKNILMIEKIELLSQKSLRERIMLYLQQQEKRQNSKKIQVPGRVQMAKELECNRSALTREIKIMQNEGILLSGPHFIEILNMD